MGRFTEAVKKKKVASPVRPGFASERWRKAAATLCDDELDKNLAAAGEWIARHVDQLQSEHVLVSRSDLSPARKLRAIVAASNFSFLCIDDIYSSRVDETLEARRCFIPEEIRAIEVAGSNGAVLPADAAVESIAAGMRVALRHMLRATTNGKDCRVTSGGSLLRDGVADLNLAIYFYCLESTWERCLWEGYEFVDLAPAIFRPRSLSMLDTFVVSRERQDHLKTYQLDIAAQQSQANLRVYASTTTRPVVDIQRLGKRQHIVFGSQSEITSIGVVASAMRVIVRQQYLEDLWHEKSLRCHGLTLDLVLGAWEIICSSAAVLMRRVQAQSPSELDVTGHAPALSKLALSDAMMAALGVDSATARALVEFFVFRGEEDDDVWAQPLVEVHVDRLAPIFATTNAPDVQRLLEIWLARLGLDLDVRGKRFEVHVRDVIAQTFKDSVHFKDGQVLPHAIKFRLPDESEKEVDLLILVGNLLIVGEAKSKVLPDEPRDWYKHREAIENGSVQAMDRARWIESNMALCQQQLLDRNFVLPDGVRVLPLVILNTALHTGWQCNGVHVVDLPMLETYFTGHLINAMVELPVGEMQMLPRLDLYSSLEEAVEKLPSYLAAPPQLRRFRKGLRDHAIPLSMPSRSGDVVAYLHSREIVVDTEAIYRALNSAATEAASAT